MVRFDDAMLKISTISIVMPIEDYYQMHPEKRPTHDHVQEWKTPREEYVPLEQRAEKNKAHFRGLLEGLKKYCEESKGIVALELYNVKLKKYKQMYSSP